jgi:hypothetical protein
MAKDDGFAGGLVMGALLARAAKPRPAGELGRNLDRAMYIRLNNKHPIPTAPSKPSQEVLELIEARDRFAREAIQNGSVAAAYKRLSQEMIKDIKGEPTAIKGISDPNAKHMRNQLLKEEEAKRRAELELAIFGKQGVVSAAEDADSAAVEASPRKPSP